MMLEKLPQFGKRLSPDNDRPTLTGPRFFQNIGGHLLIVHVGAVWLMPKPLGGGVVYRLLKPIDPITEASIDKGKDEKG